MTLTPYRAAAAPAEPSLNPDPLFDTAQAANYLSSTTAIMEKCRRLGVGSKFVKMGGRVRYRRSDLDAYIDACTRLPGSNRDEAA